MNTFRNIVSSVTDASSRLWHRSKILWFVALGVVLCICCVGFGILSSLLPGTSERATATAIARGATRTAEENLGQATLVASGALTDTASLTPTQIVQPTETQSPPTETANPSPMSSPTTVSVPTENFEGPVGVCATGCPVATPPAGCTIKGNISDQGEKIYHLPGDSVYKITKIDPAKGELWFCTVKEAEAAGFRHAQQGF